MKSDTKTSEERQTLELHAPSSLTFLFLDCLMFFLDDQMNTR